MLYLKRFVPSMKLASGIAKSGSPSNVSSDRAFRFL